MSLENEKLALHESIHTFVVLVMTMLHTLATVSHNRLMHSGVFRD